MKTRPDPLGGLAFFIYFFRFKPLIVKGNVENTMRFK
jgi:hypothetical protein